MVLSATDFEYIRKVVRENAAIVLDHGKEYLVETRLGPVAQKEGLNGISGLVEKLKSGSGNSLLTKVIEAMTTNETSFFRDFHPFETLKKQVVPEIIKARESFRELNIWCAATSSGQEPYSIAILLKENFPQLSSWRVRIVCSDISEEMLERTRQGSYSQLEVNRGLPAPLLIKYFAQNGTRWDIRNDLKHLLELRIVNLAGVWPAMGQFDIVMIRNVLIYFDIEMKKEILNKVKKIIKPDGIMFLGSTETTINIDDSYQVMHYEKTSYYKKKPS